MRLNSVFIILIIVLSFSCKKNSSEDVTQNSNFNSKDSITFYNLLDSLSQNYSEVDDSLILFSDNIVSQFPNQNAEACIKIAHVHFSKGNYYLAEHYFSNASHIFLEDSLKEEYAEQLSNIGVVKEISGSYTEALEKYFEALSIFKSLDLKLKASFIYNNIGIVYQQLKEDEKSLEYYKKSLKITQDLGRDNISAKRYNNIATHYEEFENNLDSALLYYEKALSIFIKEANNIYVPIVENNIGNIHLKKNDLIKADLLFKNALEFCTSQGLDNIKSPILSNQANLFKVKNEYLKAITKANEAIELSRKNSNKENELDGLGILIECYENTNRFKEAYQTSKEYFNLQEELSGIEQKKQINRLNIQFSVHEKEHTIQILELEKNVQSRKFIQLWLFVAVLIILLSALLLVLRLQKKNNNLKVEQMQRDIADYINQIEEIKEEKEQISQEQQKKSESKILQKIKQFGLTEREGDVLILISEGFKNNEIAEKMFVSTNTIKTHIKNIFIKLEVRNRMEAAKKAQVL